MRHPYDKGLEYDVCTRLSLAEATTLYEHALQNRVGAGVPGTRTFWQLIRDLASQVADDVEAFARRSKVEKTRRHK